MGDVNLRPFTMSHPPAHSPKDESSMPVLYYGLAVVATAAIALALYNLIVIKRCSRRHMQSQAERANRLVEVIMGSSSSVTMSFENSQRNLLSSFKYKKEAGKEGAGGDDDDEYECPVCLSVFEDGEEVRKLPRCKHSFHVPCIDMWLYSHFDCPVCRTPVGVGPFCHRFTSEISRQRLLESGGVSV